MTNEQQEQGKATRSRVGVVTSAFGDKTIRVKLSNLVKHPRYGKYLSRQTKIAVHDPKNTAAVGDQVEIAPCRRISKSKSWRLVRVVKSGENLTQTAAE